MNKPNSRAYNRDVSRRKALRKKRIAEEVYYDGRKYPYYSNLHQYSKNKIHCSCPMCSPKSNNKGKNRLKHGNYALSKNWKHSELCKRLAMIKQIEDYFSHEEEES